MIRVYQLISNPYKFPNPFIYAMIDGIESLYDDIKWGWGYEKFWTDHIFHYDIVLIQWPDAPLSWDTISKHSIYEYIHRIMQIKSKGIKIISFVHNMVPHYTTDKIKFDCYNYIYSSADVLLHMGEYSKNIFAAKYPRTEHVFIGPHFVYNQVYKSRYTREQGLAVLGFESKYKYVLAFGAFRDDEERELVSNLAHDLHLYDKDIMILAPSYMNIFPKRNRWDIRPRIQKCCLKHREHIICNGGVFNTVSDALLPYYYAVSDVCFIHRKKILNSGNVPMGFLMNKVVVGPSEGNVGEILKIMKNPIFNVEDRKSVSEAIIDAFQMSIQGKGEWNYGYAMEHFSTEIFCKKLHEIFVNVSKNQNN